MEGKKEKKPTTTDAGIPVASDEFSLTVGPDGPILKVKQQQRAFREGKEGAFRAVLPHGQLQRIAPM